MNNYKFNNNEKMEKLLSISKTCYSKIAINQFLKDKENLTNIEEYKELFNKLASVLYEIDSSETTNELNEKFENGILFPVCTEEHKRKLVEDSSLFAKCIFRTKGVFDDNIDINESIYTNEDLYNNLDKFKFL
jgi:hypothetical protein